MNTANQRLEAIFDAALELPDPAGRAALLERECAGDLSLLRQVERLLAAFDRSEDFFDKCRPSQEVAEPGDVVSNTLEEEEAGRRIGPYKLLQKIGEGGCGVVYMAQQEQPVRRRVALKIIKLGMDTKSVVARFEAERQALALMDHPNIARVLDAGATETGRPYFVMELVHGIRITDYCDEKSLDTRQRLELFIRICHAIQHAHQKGIIHRDIKPSNILVTMQDGAAVPKVIDFGIAKAIEEPLTDKTLFTMYGHFIGTPAYMSPEQAQMSGMDVDTRSDIYSLGVLLYELLTGKTPFDHKELLALGLDEMRRTLSDREPHRPSTKLDYIPNTELTMTAHRRHVDPPKLRLELRGDLDWIVMKALEKDRSRRYQTANGLAVDVQRFLDTEPVSARPPSRLYRFKKLVRRNKIVFAASGVVAVCLIVSSSVSTWLYLREREARLQANTAESQKSSLQKEAERLRQTAEDNQKYLKAAGLFRNGDYLQADQLLDEIQIPKMAIEYAPTYRDLGDWNAANGNWQKALNRFTVLHNINDSERAVVFTDDFRYASLLVDQGRFADYEEFREAIVARDAGTDSPDVAERVIRECLFTPASQNLTDALERLSKLVESSLEKNDAQKLPPHMAAYYAYSLALLAYRQKDYPSTLDWCDRAYKYDHKIQSRDLSINLIKAMTLAQEGKLDEARAQLAASQPVIENYFQSDAGKPKTWQGFWYDWVIARIHLREAISLIGGRSEIER